MCKNRDTQEIEPTKKAKGSKWFETNLEGEFSIVRDFHETIILQVVNFQKKKLLSQHHQTV